MDNTSYKRAEAILYSYPTLIAKIKNLELELEELLEYDVLPSGGNKIKPGSETYAVTSHVESEVISRSEDIECKAQELRNKIKKLKRKAKKVENLLEALSEDKRRIVQLRYFEKKSTRWICLELDVHDMTLSRKRKEIIVDYAIPLLLEGR